MGEENQELRGGQAGQVYGYYVALRQFCDVTGNSQDRSTSTRAQKARAKLLKLSPAQFFELSTDVHDELQRRIDETQEQPDHLLPKDHFHVKRNQARQKLANLSQTRFNDLVDDILYEIQRRGYHLRKPEHGSNATRGSPHHTRQSVPHSGSEASPSKAQSPSASLRGQDTAADSRKSDKSSSASGQVPMLVAPNTSVQTSQVIPKTASIDWSSDEEEVAAATKRVSRLKHMSKVMISTEDGTVVSPKHGSPGSYSARHSSPKSALLKQASPKLASKHSSPKHGSKSASPKHPSPKSLSIASTPSHKSVALMDTTSISPTSPLHQRTSSASRQALSAVLGRDKDRDIVLLLEEGNKLEAKLMQITEENKSLEQKSDELAGQVTQLLSEKEILTEQVLDLHTKLEESEKTVTDLSEEVVKLREKADAGVVLQQQISALTNQVNELTFENEALTQKNLTLTTQLADQDATVGRSMGDSFKEKLSALNSQLEELITQNQTLKLSKAELAAKLSKQQDIIASRSVDDNFQKQMSVLTNQLNDLSIENETLKQSNAELTLKLKRISNITASPLNIFIPSSSKSTNVAIESISKFISPEGSIPLPLIKSFNSKLELVFKHLNQGEQTGNVLFEDIAQVSEVVEHMLNLVSPSDYQQATLLLKAATSHAITTIRYYAAYPTILPVFTAESALTNISFAVCKLVAVAGIKQGSYDELPITPLTKVAHDEISQSNASNDGLDMSNTSHAASNFDSNDDMSTVKPLRITQKVNSALFTPPKEKPLMPRRPSGTSLISSIITSEKKEANRNRNKLNLSIPTDSSSAVPSRRGSVSSNMGNSVSPERELSDTNTIHTNPGNPTDASDGNTQRLMKNKPFDTVAGQNPGGSALPSNIGKTKPTSFLSLGKGYQQSSDSFVTAPEDNKESPTIKPGNSDSRTRSNLTLEPINFGSPQQKAEIDGLAANLTMNNDSHQEMLPDSGEVATRSLQASGKQALSSIPVASSAFSSPRSLTDSDKSDLNVTPKGVSPKVLPHTSTIQPKELNSGNDGISPSKSPGVELLEPISKQGDAASLSHSEKDDIGLSSLDTGKQSRNLGKLMKMSSDLSEVSSKHYSIESTESARSNSTPASSKKSASTPTSPISSVNRHMQTPSGVHSYSPSHVIATVTPERRVFNGFTEDSYDDNSSDDGSANTMVSDDDSTYQALKNSMRRNRAASPGSLVSAQNLAKMQQTSVADNNLKPGDTPIVDTLGGSPFNFETSSGFNGTPQTMAEAMSVTPLETNFPNTVVYDKGFTTNSYHIKPTTYAPDMVSNFAYQKKDQHMDQSIEITEEHIDHPARSEFSSSASSSVKQASPLTPQKVRLPGSNTGTISKRPLQLDSPIDEQQDTMPLQIGNTRQLHNAVSSPTSDSTVSTEEPYSANPEVFSPMRGEGFLLNSAFSVTPLGVDATSNSKPPFSAVSSSGASVRRVRLGSTKRPHATAIQPVIDDARMSESSENERGIMSSGGSSNYTGIHSTPAALTSREQTPKSQTFGKSGLSPVPDQISTKALVFGVSAQASPDAQKRVINLQSRTSPPKSETHSHIRHNASSVYQSERTDNITKDTGMFSAVKSGFPHIQQKTISAGSELDDTDFQRTQTTSTGPLPTSSEYDSAPVTVHGGLDISPRPPSSSSTDFDEYPTGTITESHRRPYNVSQLPENNGNSAATRVIKRNSSVLSSPGSVTTTPMVNRATVLSASPGAVKLTEKQHSPASSSDISTANKTHSNSIDLNTTPNVPHHSPVINVMRSITEETRNKRSSFSSSMHSDNIDGETLSKDAINMADTLHGDNAHSTPSSFAMSSLHSTPTVYAQPRNQDHAAMKPSEGPQFKKFEADAHYSSVMSSKKEGSVKEKDYRIALKNESADDRRAVEFSKSISGSSLQSDKQNIPIRKELHLTFEEQNDNTHASSDLTLEVLQDAQTRDTGSLTNNLAHTPLNTRTEAGEIPSAFETFIEESQTRKRYSIESHEISTDHGKLDFTRGLPARSEVISPGGLTTLGDFKPTAHGEVQSIAHDQVNNFTEGSTVHDEANATEGSYAFDKLKHSEGSPARGELKSTIHGELNSAPLGELKSTARTEAISTDSSPAREVVISTGTSPVRNEVNATEDSTASAQVKLTSNGELKSPVRHEAISTGTSPARAEVHSTEDLPACDPVKSTARGEVISARVSPANIDVISTGSLPDHDEVISTGTSPALGEMISTGSSPARGDAVHDESKTAAPTQLISTGVSPALGEVKSVAHDGSRPTARTQVISTGVSPARGDAISAGSSPARGEVKSVAHESRPTARTQVISTGVSPARGDVISTGSSPARTQVISTGVSPARGEVTSVTHNESRPTARTQAISTGVSPADSDVISTGSSPARGEVKSVAHDGSRPTARTQVISTGSSPARGDVISTGSSPARGEVTSVAHNESRPTARTQLISTGVSPARGDAISAGSSPARTQVISTGVSPARGDAISAGSSPARGEVTSVAHNESRPTARTQAISTGVSPADSDVISAGSSPARTQVISTGLSPARGEVESVAHDGSKTTAYTQVISTGVSPARGGVTSVAHDELKFTGSLSARNEVKFTEDLPAIGAAKSIVRDEMKSTEGSASQVEMVSIGSSPARGELKSTARDNAVSTRSSPASGEAKSTPRSELMSTGGSPAPGKLTSTPRHAAVSARSSPARGEAKSTPRSELVSIGGSPAPGRLTSTVRGEVKSTTRVEAKSTPRHAAVSARSSPACGEAKPTSRNELISTGVSPAHGEIKSTAHDAVISTGDLPDCDEVKSTEGSDAHREVKLTAPSELKSTAHDEEKSSGCSPPRGEVTSTDRGTQKPNLLDELKYNGGFHVRGELKSTGGSTTHEVCEDLPTVRVSTDREHDFNPPSTTIASPDFTPSNVAMENVPAMTANSLPGTTSNTNDIAKDSMADSADFQRKVEVKLSTYQDPQMEHTPVKTTFGSPQTASREPLSIPTEHHVTPMKRHVSQYDDNNESEFSKSGESRVFLHDGGIIPQEKLPSTRLNTVGDLEGKVSVSKAPAGISTTPIYSEGVTNSENIVDDSTAEKDNKSSHSRIIGKPSSLEEPKDDHPLPKSTSSGETTNIGKDRTAVGDNQQHEHIRNTTIPKDSPAIKHGNAAKTYENDSNISRTASHSMKLNARPSAAPLILKTNNNHAPLSREAELPRKTTTYEPETPRIDFYGTPTSANSTYTDQSDDYDDDGEIDFNVDDFDIENPDNTLAELLLYLEHQTIDVISTIQSLLTGIKQPKATTGVLRRESNAINQVIGQMAGATSVSMNQSRNAALKEHGNWVVQSLVDCRRRITVLCNLRPDGILVADERDDHFADKHFKQRLAGVAFDVAKCTKELVKTVEEASLKEEIEYLNSKLAK
uniref:Spa2p n=1 Tax=Eremothecium gossypii TaxID=33169 RepID=Q7ZA38_EREGO|nr:Spa2p [Eremothecium gossypii]